jgi:plasmid stabilization system protein ParE
MNVRYEPAAQQELAEAVVYYDDRSSELARRPVADLDAAISRILAHPRAWPPLGKNLRRCLLTDFPYQLVYGVEQDAIRIFAFAHLSRRPDYWRKRVRGQRRDPPT